MPLGEYCEQCRRRPIDFAYLTGGEPEPFDYCATCSKDLCPDCFKNPCDDDLTLQRNAEHHTPAVESED